MLEVVHVGRMTKSQAKKRLMEARAKVMKTVEGDGFNGAPPGYLNDVFKLAKELDRMIRKLN